MYKCFKRAFDLISSLLLFIVISPFFLLLCLIVYIQIGSPIFFRQTRCTKGGKKFTMIKFRSMTNQKDENGDLLPDELRLTPIGRFFRSTSIDELPELLNIINGNMSVIGPRPLLPENDEYYTQREKKRYLVRGGLIPPEVLFGNVQPTWDEQLEYEAWYAENVSLKTDFKIMISVFKGLFKRYENVYGEYVRLGLDEERKNKKDQTQEVGEMV